MAFTIEKILNDAHNLSTRLKEHNLTADGLIARTQSLQRQVESMKQYQDSLNELNEIARHRPRANLILSLAQENSQIRELQQENKELRESLDEHQTALELIMSKYREQISKLLKADRLERAYITNELDRSQEMEDKMEKIYEMAAVMWKAIKIDDQYVDRDRQVIAQLMKENATMRELLQISMSYTQNSSLQTSDENTQTEEFVCYDDPRMEDLEYGELSSPDGFKSLSSSVIVKSFDDSGVGNSTVLESTTWQHGHTLPPSGIESNLEDAGEQAEVSAALQLFDDISADFEAEGQTDHLDLTSSCSHDTTVESSSDP